MAKPLPSQEHLRNIFDYDPVTGVLRWRYREDKHPRWNGANAGREAGCTLTNGYVQVCIDLEKYCAHRVIFKLMTGREPKCVIDHRDSNPSNNRWANLREATVAENSQNKIVRRKGLRGTKKKKYRPGWDAQIEVNRKTIHLGYFQTEEAAHAAYCRAAQKYHREFAKLEVA